MIITIDGPTGTGKSTVAKKLAETLGIHHFDTGAMYRCLTYGILKNKIDIHNKEQLKKYLKSFTFQVKNSGKEKKYFVEGEDVTSQIRQQKVTSKVSEVSAIPVVRVHLVMIQRKFGEDTNAVFEGRDLGTVVFPKANLKIFLTADPEIRAKRRYDELVTKFPDDADSLTIEKVLSNINYRDEYDTNRTHSPLRQAEDAHVIDSSILTIDEVIEAILEIYRS